MDSAKNAMRKFGVKTEHFCAPPFLQKAIRFISQNGAVALFSPTSLSQNHPLRELQNSTRNGCLITSWLDFDRIIFVLNRGPEQIVPNRAPGQMVPNRAPGQIVPNTNIHFAPTLGVGGWENFKP
eukprot:10881593-Karenia_brevis.AAC.1